MKSIIYNFIWLHKDPLVSFNQFCLPFSQEGVGLLSSETQHLVLQVRHLRQLFDSSSRSLLVRPFLLYHMTLISEWQDSPMLSFFVSEFRKHKLNHFNSIIHFYYKTFDHFHFEPDFPQMPLQLVLQLPIRYLFVSISSEHRINRHPNFLTTNFFLCRSSLASITIPSWKWVCHKIPIMSST